MVTAVEVHLVGFDPLPLQGLLHVREKRPHRPLQHEHPFALRQASQRRIGPSLDGAGRKAYSLSMFLNHFFVLWRARVVL
jgi:hypothetical protein